MQSRATLTGGELTETRIFRIFGIYDTVGRHSALGTSVKTWNPSR